MTSVENLDLHYVIFKLESNGHVCLICTTSSSRPCPMVYRPLGSVSLILTLLDT
jgi:hypothetical protein